MGRPVLLAMGFLAAISCPLQAGWNFNALKDLDLVKARYLGYTDLVNGVPEYGRGDVVMFRISIQNFGNRPFKNFPVETQLHWADTVICDGRVYAAGEPVEWGGRSGLQFIEIDKMDTGYVDVSYQIPNDACPNLVEIHLHGGRGGKADADGMVLRERFLFE